MVENWHQNLKNKHKHQLIAAAKELFMSHSFLSVSIKDVCEKAEISRVTFYKHFQSIDELTFEVQMDVLQGMIQFISEQTVQTSQPNGLKKLQGILEAWLEYASKFPRHIKFMILFDLHYEDKKYAEELKQYYELFIETNKTQNFMLKPIEEGIQDGSIQPRTEALETAQFIFTSMMGLLSRLSLFPEDDLSNTIAKQFTDMLLSHIGNTAKI